MQNDPISLEAHRVEMHRQLATIQEARQHHAMEMLDVMDALPENMLAQLREGLATNRDAAGVHTKPLWTALWLIADMTNTRRALVAELETGELYRVMSLQ